MKRLVQSFRFTANVRKAMETKASTAIFSNDIYGVRDSPRGYTKLFQGICKGFNLTQLKNDECVYVKIVKITMASKATHDLSHLHKIQPNVDQHYRVYHDCAYPIGILIVCSYVDDNFFFTNRTQLAEEFETYCNTHIEMTSEGPVN